MIAAHSVSVRDPPTAALVESRQLVSQFATPEALSVAFQRFIAANSDEAYILYRELDYFEQLAALDHLDHFDFELINLGCCPVNRWLIIGRYGNHQSTRWGGSNCYPLFEGLPRRCSRLSIRLRMTTDRNEVVLQATQDESEE
jgi:hypothetical protein